MRLIPSIRPRKPAGSRKRKPVCLVAVEGANKTEKNYISTYARDHGAKYKIRYVSGNYTDIPNMANVLLKEMKELAVDVSDGDKAYIFADLDNISSGKKLKNMKNGIKKCEKSGVKPILSNPCFEIWFLLHYQYTTAAFSNGEDLIKHLKKYLPNYEKNQDIYAKVQDKTKKAMRNAKRLSKHQNELEKNILLQNPRTNMYEFLEEIEI